MNYCTVAQLRAELGDDGAVLPETLLQKAVTAASRAVDGWCGRPPGAFGLSELTSRLYRPCDPVTVAVDDIGSREGLTVATDDDGDGVFETIWDATEYVLEPLNADTRGTAYAWQAITAVGARRWPCGSLRPALRVTARWGWSAVPDDVTAATILRAVALFKRKEAPYGVAEFGEFGPVRISRQDTDVISLLTPYRRWVVA